MAPPIDVEAERVRAVSSLAALQRLTRLSFHARSNGELAALAGLTQLQQLWLSLQASCSLQFLVQLAGMQKLRLLQLQVPLDCFMEIGESMTSDGALLSSLKHVARFELSVVVGGSSEEGAYWKDMIDDAKQWVDDCGLGRPAEMVVLITEGYEPPR
jgi:hypothetical protein